MRAHVLVRLGDRQPRRPDSGIGWSTRPGAGRKQPPLARADRPARAIFIQGP